MPDSRVRSQLAQRAIPSFTTDATKFVLEVAAIWYATL